MLRLIGIINPPLEISHNWRQSLTNMVARNFVETGPNLLYPQIDMAGNLSGIIGSEFPLFNFLIYLMSELFGYAHWYGRLINLIVSSFGIYFFFLLLEKICNKKIAFNASIVLLSSIWFAFSRKIMPDTFSVSLVIIGLYYCYMFICSGSLKQLFLYFLFATLGMLCKIPALCLISGVSVFVFMKEIPISRKLQTFAVTSLSILFVSAWYFYWVPYLLNTYKYQLYFPKGLLEGLAEILPLLPQFFEKFYFSALNSYLAFTLFLVGTYYLFRSHAFYLKSGILVISGVFLIFILKTGAVFPLHNYYIIPFVPVMALVVGYGIYKIPFRYQYLMLFLVCLEGIANQQHDFFIKNTEKYKLSLEDLSDKYIEKNELVVINGGPSPQQIYFLNRKGWTVNNSLLRKESLDSLKILGASYLVVNRRTYPDDISSCQLLISTEDYRLYRIE